MNHLENEYFQKEVESEIKREYQEFFFQKRYEEPKTIESLKGYVSEEMQKLFKKVFVFLISLSSDQFSLNAPDLNESKELLREKEEANQKIIAKLLEFNAFLESFQ